jgi:micrococcal nuclease
MGIDSPELHRPVECFGQQAADHATEMLTGAKVRLIADPTQDDRDRYGRLLRYVELADGTDVNAALIHDGYAFEYTYDAPYQRQELFRRQEADASAAGVGLWSPATCAGHGVTPTGTGPPAGTTADSTAVDSTAQGTTTADSAAPPDGCAIKGNINRRGERIYHLPGDSSYDGTVITASKGERYFCTVAEALAAGWRAAER